MGVPEGVTGQGGVAMVQVDHAEKERGLKLGKAVAVVTGGTVAAGALLIGVSLATEGTGPTERSTVVKLDEPIAQLSAVRCPSTVLPTRMEGGSTMVIPLCAAPVDPEGIRHLVVPPSDGG
ncbi:hypothetical protein [Saccharopolyspora hattusasensis]|uniref:hypothetical protein n=1 Tax=Saccharopolyspora hattusasensis TaxID=1128679 RepID=UPI003D980A8C